MLRELKLPDRIPNHTKTMECPWISFVLQLLTSVWSLQPYRLQHARLPCSSPSPGASSCVFIESGMPSNHLVLCHSFLLLPSMFPSIRVFSKELALHIKWPIFQASASSSVLLMNIQDWFPLRLTGLIVLPSKQLSRVFSNTTVQKHQFFGTQPSLWCPALTSVHDYLENHSIDKMDLVGKVMSLLLNLLLGLS